MSTIREVGDFVGEDFEMGDFGRSSELRSRISEDDFGGLRIVIPSRGSWFVRIFLVFWLCGWAVGEVVASYLMIANAPVGLFLLIWLIPWTIGGSMAFLVLLWNLAGREVVVVSKSGILIQRLVGPWGRSRRIDFDAIRSLRYTPIADLSFPRHFGENQRSRRRRTPPGGIAVDFESGFLGAVDTTHFGTDLAEIEARRLVLTIRQRFHFPEEPALEPLPIQS